MPLFLYTSTLPFWWGTGTCVGLRCVGLEKDTVELNQIVVNHGCVKLEMQTKWTMEYTTIAESRGKCG